MTLAQLVETDTSPGKQEYRRVLRTPQTHTHRFFALCFRAPFPPTCAHARAARPQLALQLRAGEPAVRRARMRRLACAVTRTASFFTLFLTCVISLALSLRSTRFLRALLAEREDFGQRMLTQRLVVYQRWVKSFTPELMNDAIQEANKALLIQRLSTTVNMSLEAPDRECVAEDGTPEPCPDAE
jgi:hypothetical protein